MLQVNLNVTYSSNKNSIKTLSNKTLFPENVQLKQLLGMTSIFVFNFVMKLCIPEIHDFIFFRVFKIFFIHTFMNPTVPQTNFLYT